MKKLMMKNHFIKNYAYMWPFVKPFWFVSLLSLLIGIPIGALDSIVALFLKPYTDLVIVGGGNNIDSPWYLPFLIVGFTIIQGILIFASSYLTTYAGGKLNIAVKEKLYKKLIRLDTSYYDSQNTGVILMRFSSDADMACSGLLHNLKQLVTRTCSTLALAGVLLYTSWQLAIIAIIVLGITVAPLTFVRRLMKKIVARNVEVSQKINMNYNETYMGNKTIRAYNLQDDRTNFFLEHLRQTFRLSIKMIQRTAWISPFMHFSVAVGISLTIAYGSWLIAQGTITSGDFVAFIAALLLMYTPIKAMGNTIVNIQASFLAIERIQEILEMQSQIADKKNAHELTAFNREISFHAVDFSYKENIPVLNKLSLKIEKNQTVALVGNSGGGKSTIISLLPRFYDVQGGSISIDGIDVRDLNIQSLRRQMSLVFQDNFLFFGTIRDNIMLGKPEATEKELQQAIQSAYLDDFLESLPQGIDTQIGERGAMLSGGQKQRVAIARAFLRNAPILVLDEATSALDNKSEAIVQQAIENLMKNKTVIIIAHRLSTIRNADKIAFIQEGEVAEFGTHEELMEIPNGLYRHLYQLQFHKQHEEQEKTEPEQTEKESA